MKLARVALAVGLSSVAVSALCPTDAAAVSERFLDTHLLVTWYGNPHSCQMGILGERSGPERAAGLRQQAGAYARMSRKQIVAAYHLVAVVAQRAPGSDQRCRRRESAEIIQSLLVEARESSFKLVLDIQPGRSDVRDELEYLRPFLLEPDVYLALDPEFAMAAGQVPGRQRGSMRAADVNAALDFLDRLVSDHQLPPKVLIVHQFALDMLPDKQHIRRSPNVDLVLNMDGFGSQALKRASYNAIMRQHELDFAGVKLFYRLDTALFSPEEVLGLRPMPSVIIYQ